MLMTPQVLYAEGSDQDRHGGCRDHCQQGYGDGGKVCQRGAENVTKRRRQLAPLVRQRGRDHEHVNLALEKLDPEQDDDVDERTQGGQERDWVVHLPGLVGI